MTKMLCFALIALAASSSASLAQGYNYGTGSSPDNHYVQGHTTSSGTYVAPHYQTNPNGNTHDNYGAAGNYNPHNGQTGRGW